MGERRGSGAGASDPGPEGRRRSQRGEVCRRAGPMSGDGSGPEVNLTNTRGLDDGPEYTPDGKYIYFNGIYTQVILLCNH